MDPQTFHATTILSVRRNGHVAVAGDGQVTLGHTVMKGNARKVRRLGRDGQVLAGFAGAAADAFTLFELFEAKLEKHGQLTRAAVELAKDWRTERRLGKLADPWGDMIDWGREFSVVAVKYRLFADAADWLGAREVALQGAS